MTRPDASRRLFLHHAATLAATGGGPLALNLSLAARAAAQTAADYKALVCALLEGSNDASDTVLATDAPSWAAYRATRGHGNQPAALREPGTPPDRHASPGSAAQLGGVLPIRQAHAQGRSFALHPALGALQRLFDTERRLSIVANVGPLAAPTTKADLARGAHPLPPKLFPHNDRQNLWQAMAPEGAGRVWGGRIGDLLAAANGHALFTAVTTGARPVWASGAKVHPVAVSAAGAVPFGTDDHGSSRTASPGSTPCSARWGRATR